MSIASEIERINNNIEAAYDAVEDAGLPVPEEKNSAGLGALTEKALFQAQLIIGLGLNCGDATPPNTELLDALYQHIKSEGIELQIQPYDIETELERPDGFIIIGSKFDGDPDDYKGYIIRPLGGLDTGFVHDAGEFQNSPTLALFPKRWSFLKNVPSIVMHDDNGGMVLYDCKVRDIGTNQIVLLQYEEGDFIINTGDVDLYNTFLKMKRGTMSKTFTVHSEEDEGDYYFTLGKF